MHDAADEQQPAGRVWIWRGGDSARDLRLVSRPAAPLTAGQVRVRNHAIGLNPVDWKVLKTQMGKTPGVDGAGVVVAVADDVDPAWLGQRVAYHQNLQAAGSFADYTPILAHTLLTLPPALSFASAAAFPCPGLTAWMALEKLPPRAGAEVLIAGAGGAVGLFLVQLAVARGFTVTAVCHPRHWPRLTALGAAQCLPREPLAWPAGMTARYYAAIDCVNEHHAEQLSPLLRANGHLVCIQGRVERWPNPPFGRAISLHEVALGALHQHGDRVDWRQLVVAGEALLAQIAAGTLQPETLLTFPFSQLAAQLDALQHRSFSGKQIIDAA